MLYIIIIIKCCILLLLSEIHSTPLIALVNSISSGGVTIPLTTTYGIT